MTLCKTNEGFVAGGMYPPLTGCQVSTALDIPLLHGSFPQIITSHRGS